MSREQVARRRSESNRVTGTVGAGWPAGRRESRRWRAGTAAGEDVVAAVMIRPPLSCVKYSATSGTMGWGRDGMIDGEGSQRGREGVEGRQRLEVKRRKVRRGPRRAVGDAHVVSSASGARHRCKESRRCEETLRYQNR